MKHGGCRSSDVLFFYNVLHKGGYGSVHRTVHQQETAHFHNRITVRFYSTTRFNMLHNITSPTPPPSFLVAGGTQEKLQNMQQGERAGIDTARTWHGIDTART